MYIYLYIESKHYKSGAERTNKTMYSLERGLANTHTRVVATHVWLQHKCRCNTSVLSAFAGKVSIQHQCLCKRSVCHSSIVPVYLCKRRVFPSSHQSRVTEFLL